MMEEATPAPGGVSTAPTAVAVRDGDILTIATCPLCGHRHQHGAAGGEGLRLAHCERGTYTLRTPEER